MIEKILQWSQFEWGSWTLTIAASAKGLCYTDFDQKGSRKLADWASKRFPDLAVVRDDEKLQPYTDELTAYFSGRCRHFSLPVALTGTPFQLSVWHALRMIPYGETRTYSEIAVVIQRPDAVRAVGAAIGANPLLIVIPCHRVIGKNGKLTGYRGGLEMKQHLLRLEGRQSGDLGD
ncbi:methylated-DNA--[protein]-cysteine S-methyltransferase [Bacillus sp. z60-18]|uniref:methylated-DNA--[protein]-cysteine S-methyltransferase n=1 Tax=unclassified Bacillus (in: firmicutes) TaxID=185979 RepID=UPI00390C58DE